MGATYRIFKEKPERKRSKIENKERATVTRGEAKQFPFPLLEAIAT
jgi:hypothetical protein